jgi:elongation factor P
MPRASEVKRGDVVDINDVAYIVKEVEVRNPSARGAQTLYKFRFNHAQTRQKFEQTFTGDDILKEANFAKRPVQYLYQDADGYVFMDKEDYAQYTLDAETIEDQLPFLTDTLESIVGLMVNDELVGVELPQVVVLEVVDTVPAMKSASATARTKPAKLSTGAEVQVPEYVENGTMVRVNTQTGKFMSRA